MKRMRTIKGAIAEIKQEDPYSCITEHFLRQLIWQGKLQPCKAGNKNLIDMDELIDFLGNHANSTPPVSSVELEKLTPIPLQKSLHAQVQNQVPQRIRRVLDYSR